MTIDRSRSFARPFAGSSVGKRRTPRQPLARGTIATVLSPGCDHRSRQRLASDRFRSRPVPELSKQGMATMSEVNFGVFDWIDRGTQPLSELYEDRLQLLAAADEAGFFCYHLAEHHATPLGMAPSPALFLTAATQRTRRIRLGPLVYLLPLYDPLRLIEEVAMLDQLSGGRLELGVGRGVSPYELHNFGVDPAKSREMFDEALTVLLAGLTRQRLSFAGVHYQYEDVPIELHSLQQPYPPLWYPTHSQAASNTPAGMASISSVSAPPQQCASTRTHIGARGTPTGMTAAGSTVMS